MATFISHNPAKRERGIVLHADGVRNFSAKDFFCICLCSSSKMPSSFEILRFAPNSRARVRSTAFLHRPSTEPNSPDDLFLKLRVFGSLTREEYCRCALRFIAGGAAKTEVGVEAAGSIREEGISRREVSVEP
jgi:hypothetical protein